MLDDQPALSLSKAVKDLLIILCRMEPIQILIQLEIGCKQGFQYTPRKIIIVYKQWSRNGYVEK